VRRKLINAIDALQPGLTKTINFEVKSLGERRLTGKGPERDRRVEISFLKHNGSKCLPPSSPSFCIWLQKLLNQILGLRIPVDGRYGQKTKDKLLYFKILNNLPVNDGVDHRTFSELAKGSTQKGPASKGLTAGVFERGRCFVPHINVWAELSGPSKTNRDARLDGREWPRGPYYPDGTPNGQVGWDMGIQAASLDNLAEKLHTESTPRHVCEPVISWCESNCCPIVPGQIYRLAIVGHGAPGQMEVRSFCGGSKSPDCFLTHQSVGGMHKAALKKIGRLLDPEEGRVLLIGCNAGKGPAGSRLLIELSNLWKGRRVTGFIQGMYYQNTHGNPGYRIPKDELYDNTCKETYGMCSGWDDPKSDKCQCEYKRYGQYWNDLGKLPWASEFSRWAKTAENGILIRDPESISLPGLKSKQRADSRSGSIERRTG